MLPEYFKINIKNGVAADSTIFRGEKYRITILSERLIRFEYDENGIFLDLPTEFAINRSFPSFEMEVKQDDKFLEVQTSYFKLSYEKEKRFIGTKLAPDAKLRVALKNSDKVWYFNHPEARNYMGNNVSNDLTNLKFKKSLYSTDGFVSFDDSNSLVFDENGALQKIDSRYIDTYLFAYRNDFSLCLKDYFTLTGPTPLLPRYAYGIWWYKNEVYDEFDIYDLAKKFNKHNIPLSLIIIGSSWHNKMLIDKKEIDTGYTFNHDLFKNPAETTKFLHDRAIRVGLEIDPLEGILPTEDVYSKMKEELRTLDGDIIPFNVFDTNFVASYFNNVIKPLSDLGIDMFFINGDFKDTNDLAVTNHYFSTFYNSNPETRPLLLSKITNIASHRYPVHYPGRSIVSFDNLKSIPYININSANIGLSYWSHDIGGYKNGTEEAELYTRYVQLGTFSPIFRFSGEAGKYYKREPWKWEIKTTNIVSDYCRLRHRLIPYLYSEGYKLHKNGTPICQPIYYSYPKIYDEPLYKNEYYFGSELFVAPITKAMDQIMQRSIEKIFLPEGTWYEFKTGKKFPGGKRYTAFYTEDDYPVFAKSGSIIPLAILEKNKNITKSGAEMEIHVFPGKSNVYTLYEDDGVSSLYESKYYIKTSIDYNYQENNYTLIIRAIEGKTGIIPEKRNYKIRFRNILEAETVMVFENETKKECSSYIEDNDFIVEVKDVATTSQLSINCKGEKIEIDSVRLINEDIDSIINDAKIKTELKVMIAKILFSDISISKKRIRIRRLKSYGLEKEFIKMFLKLLDYVADI